MGSVELQKMKNDLEVDREKIIIFTKELISILDEQDSFAKAFNSHIPISIEMLSYLLDQWKPQNSEPRGPALKQKITSYRKRKKRLSIIKKQRKMMKSKNFWTLFLIIISALQG